MKKILLSLSLLSCSLLGYGVYATLSGEETVPTTPEQEIEGNLLANGTFSNPAELPLQATEDYTDAVPEGKWMVLSTDTEKANAEIADGGEGHPTVAKFSETTTFTNPSGWWSAYIMQNINGGLKAKKYKISFDAKGTGKVWCWAYVGGPAKLYAKKPGFDVTDANSQASGARWDKAVTADWAHFEVELDFSILINNVNSPKSVINGGKTITETEATAELLKMVRICFSNNNTVNTFMIDNVVLSSDEPDPDPVVPGEPETPAEETEVEGNLIMDGTFSTTTEIPVQAGANWGNLGEQGIWRLCAANNESLKSSIVDGGDGHPTAIKFDKVASTGLSWYTAFLFQDLKPGAKRQTVKLSFDAKSVGGNKTLCTMIFLGGNNQFALRKGFDKAATPGQSGAKEEITLTDEWAHYDVEYDFTQWCNNITSPSGYADWAVAETTQEMIDKLVRVCFNDYTSVGSFLIDNVVLLATGEPVAEPEPEPEPEPETPTFDPEDEVAGNLIANGTFSNPAELPIQATENYTDAVPEGKWMAMTTDPEKVKMTVVDGGEGHPSAVQFDEKSSLSWWLGYLFQNVNGGLEAKTYILSFDAKSVSGSTNLSTWAYVGGPSKLYAMKPGFNYDDLTSQASGARYDKALTSEWDHYEFEFDFELLLNNINSPSSQNGNLKASEATAEQLKMVRICINNYNKVGSFMVDNVVLKPANETGVDNVMVDNENAPVEYYNLQGVRVANPSQGQLYIKRQGNKAVKIKY